jgi:pimeloyl-ACP methyl ester carboxylesterase
VIFADTFASNLPMAGRDLVMLDQRGTGASGLLRCPSIEGDESAGFSRAVARCARRLGTRRSFYTSADSAEDVEALRIRLGVPRIALFAVSYGTRVAVEYARRHPDRLERLILDSPIAAEGLDPLARDTLGAVPRVLKRLCRSGCGGAEARPVADMARLVKRLRRAPIRRTVQRGNRKLRITVDADDLLGLLVSGDLDPSFMRRIPPAVRAALRGNSRLLVGLTLRAPGEIAEPLSVFSPAVYVATTCEESPTAWDPSGALDARRAQARAALAAAPASALAPFDRTAALRFGLLSLCGGWPAPARLVAPAPPLPTTVPALVLSGELDLRTPTESARALAQALNARLVTERGAGHSVLGQTGGGCATQAVESFLAGRGAQACRPGGPTISIGP